MRSTSYRGRVRRPRVRRIPGGFTERVKGDECPNSATDPNRHFTPVATDLVTPNQVLADLEGAEGYKREVFDARD